MYTNFHDDLLVLTTAQQDRVLIAQPSRGTVHGLELHDTMCIMMDNGLKEWLELKQMQYVHLPDLVCQVLPKSNGQWL